MAVRACRVIPLVFVLVAACGGKSGNGAIRIEAPSIEPHRVAIRTLDPVPSPSSSPAPSVNPSASPATGPTPAPVPPPGGATITSAAGTQKGAPNSFCWSTQVGGASQCYQYPPPSQPSGLLVASGETALVRIQVQIPPDQEAVRPFRGTREGYPSQRIPPAIETDLKVDLPAGDWSLDLCATWHDRGEPICWLFRLNVH